MRIGWNIAMVCITAVLCTTAIAITGLAMGHDGTLVALSFTAVGAVPASLITYMVVKLQNKSKHNNGGGE